MIMIYIYIYSIPKKKLTLVLFLQGRKAGWYASVLSPLAGRAGVRRAAAEADASTVPRVPRFQVTAP